MGDALETAEKAVKIVVVAAVGAGALALGYAGYKHATKDSDTTPELGKSCVGNLDELAIGRHNEDKLRAAFDKKELDGIKDLKKVLEIRGKMAVDVGLKQTDTVSV